MNNMQLFGLYFLLSKVSICQHSYMFKIMLAILFATLLPLVIVFSYLLVFNLPLSSLFLPLLLSLTSIALNILLLYWLLKPIFYTSYQLDNYVNTDATHLHLPTEYNDDIGLLMSNVQYVTQKLEFLTRNQTQDPNLDPLTGVLNRPAGEERLRQDIARASRDNSRLLVALLDIDNFSQINENFGRRIGDVCLGHVAEVTMNNIRKGDWIARWGGDKFLMVLWNFNNGEPYTVLKRIRQESVTTPMNELLQVHLSIGACDYQHEIELDILLNKLNECMYLAKQAEHSGIEICSKN